MKCFSQEERITQDKQAGVRWKNKNVMSKATEHLTKI